jgi:hypothetical protein
MNTYSIEVAVREETSTTGDGGPAALPAALLRVLQGREVETGLLQRSRALLLVRGGFDFGGH